MKTLKNKYLSMKKKELEDALSMILKSITSARMTVRDDPKSSGQLQKMRYELALVRSLLSMRSNE